MVVGGKEATSRVQDFSFLYIAQGVGCRATFAGGPIEGLGEQGRRDLDATASCEFQSRDKANSET